jgi:hypothetical protein
MTKKIKVKTLEEKAKENLTKNVSTISNEVPVKTVVPDKEQSIINAAEDFLRQNFSYDQFNEELKSTLINICRSLLNDTKVSDVYETLEPILPSLNLIVDRCIKEDIQVSDEELDILLNKIEKYVTETRQGGVFKPVIGNKLLKVTEDVNANNNNEAFKTAVHKTQEAWNEIKNGPSTNTTEVTTPNVIKENNTQSNSDDKPTVINDVVVNPDNAKNRETVSSVNDTIATINKTKSVLKALNKRFPGKLNLNLNNTDDNYENVNHPNHYNTYDVEVIDMMERIWGPEKTAIFCELNAFKYRMRMGTKPTSPVSEDLNKETWYLEKFQELKAKL